MRLTRPRLRPAALLAALTATSACYGMMGGELVRPGEPIGQLALTNASRTPITQVLISECRASSYGLNRMPQSMVLQPGQTWTISVSAGCYDVMMGYGTATGYAAATRHSLTVRPGQVTRYGATD